MFTNSLKGTLATLCLAVAAGCGGADTVASNTVVDVATGNPQFSKLAAAVVKAGLAGTLAGPGP